MDVVAGGGDVEVAHGGEEVIRRADDQSGNVVGLDTGHAFAVGVQSGEAAEDDVDEVIRHGVERDLGTGEHDGGRC